MADNQQALYTAEATTKYAKEYAAVQDMVDNIVLADAAASVQPGAANVKAGFGVSPVAAITFEGVGPEDDKAYRSVAETHAKDFASTLNQFFSVQQKDGQTISLVGKDLAKVDGATVNVDLGEVHNLFNKDLPVAVDIDISMLSKMANQYSKQSVIPLVVQNTEAQIDEAAAANKMAREQKEMADKLYPECDKVLESPAHLKEIAATDPKTATMVRQIVGEVLQAAAESKKNPEALDALREENPAFAELVDKAVAKIDKKAVAQENKQSNAAEEESVKQSGFADKEAKPAGFAAAEKERAATRGTGAAIGG